MNASQSIASLAEALSKAQGEMDKAVKDRDNPAFRGAKYADLANVIDVVKAVAPKYGLSFAQIAHDVENHAAIETVIMHASGEWLSTGTVSVPVTKQDAQGYGSALSYARRYSLSAAFGVAADDDDGNAAAKAKPVMASFKSVPKMVMDEQDPVETERLMRIGQTCIDLYQNGEIDEALDEYDKVKDAEKRTAIWSMFDSKMRTALRKLGTERRQQAIAPQEI